MPKRLLGLVWIVLSVMVIMPKVAYSQRSARMRVVAHVTASTVLETREATEQRLASLAEEGISAEVNIAKRPLSTEKGIAHIFTELMDGDSNPAPNISAPQKDSADQVGQDRIRITVAYTAN